MTVTFLSLWDMKFIVITKNMGSTILSRDIKFHKFCGWVLVKINQK